MKRNKEKCIFRPHYCISKAFLKIYKRVLVYEFSEMQDQCTTIIFACSSVQSLSHVQLFATPCTASYQASLFITISQSLLKLMSIELVMPSNHLILCHPLLLPPSMFRSIRGFSNESAVCIRWPKYWSFSFSKLSHLLWHKKGGPET